MQLKLFGTKAPATTINAKDLDDNFRRLRPLATDGSPRHYYLTETPDGWSIRVLPPFPSGAGPFFLAYSGTALYWAGSGIDEPSGGGTSGGNSAAFRGFLPAYPTSGDGPFMLGVDDEGQLYWTNSGVNEPTENNGFNGLVSESPPSSGTYVYGSVNGNTQWLPTANC